MNEFTALMERALLKGYASSAVDIQSVFLCLGLSTLISLYIYAFYRIMSRGRILDDRFSLSLIGMSVLASAVLLTVQSSIVVSVGMVGALSIVRFRTAVKEPMDLVFLFWSVVSGIICGAGFALIAVVATLLLSVILLLLTRIPSIRPTQLLSVNAASFAHEQQILAVVRQNATTMKVHARNVTSAGLNMTIELRTADDHKLIDELMKTNGVITASLVSHNGEITA